MSHSNEHTINSHSQVERRPSKPSSTHSKRTDNGRTSQDVARRSSERRQVMRIQNYVIYRKTIGAGSMGKVKLAECLTDKYKQKYAVKIMPKIDLTSPAVLSTRVKDPKDTPVEREQRTVREMAIMHLLNHPNICQLKEWISEGEHYYMFLEYVDGGQLLDYIINHGKLREKQARKFARQIVSALDYCHRNSIVHRDLKIENILITKDEDIKIIDFGLSNLYSPSSQLSTFCGSLYFAAPELLQARQYTGPEVDVWSFGVVLYVLVCGRVPFDDTSLPALHAKIKAGVVDHYPDHLSKDCVDLLSNLLVVDPKKRATLSAIRSHPWINKGYDEPIYNHLPHRLPLNTIDMKTVEGMHGFGLGEPEDIRDKLEHYISLSEYQQAASKIDQNYQRHAASQNEASRPRWRRSLIHKKKRPTHDDPQSLPAMYDPLVSVYYLVKERKEFDEQQAMEDNLSVYSSPDLRRSNSSLSRTKYEQHTLTRRKSERIPATPRLNIEEIQGNGHGEGYRALTRSRSERTSSTIKENAAKLMGVVRSHSRGEDPERPDPPSFLSPPSITSADPESISSSHSTPVKKPHHYWWKFDNSATQPRSSWRRLSVNKHSSKRSLADPLERSTSDSLAIPPVPRVASANIDIRKDTTITNSSSTPLGHIGSPKSLFNFNRRHLFRTTPQQMMECLSNILRFIRIRTELIKGEPFSLACQCDYPLWQTFLNISSSASSGGGSGSLASRTEELSLSDTGDANDYGHKKETLYFTVMVYQARWAGGRLGIKVKEAEVNSEKSTIYQNIYYYILGELEKSPLTQQASRH